jgi:ribosomal protein S18 acetylase RimI-like enzyme
MELKSLGYKTDLIFTKLDGEVLDRKSYLVVKTLSNPNYFWGNLLIFDRAPRAGDFAEWKNLFSKEFLDPSIYHMTFAWDSEDLGDIAEFVTAGFKFEKGIVLTAAAGKIHMPKKHHPRIQVSPPKNSQDWEDSIQVQIACGSEVLSKREWEAFYRSQMDRYRRLIDLGQGQWFCAYLNDRVVAGPGIFKDSKIGRFQIVSTHPDFQRQGICGSLVYKAAQYAFKEMKLETLVMVADEEYHAAKVYESVGFRPTEKLLGLCKAEKFEQ